MRQKLFRNISIYSMLAVLSLVSFMPIASAEDIPSGITVGPPVVEYKVEKGTTTTGTVRINDYAPVPITLYPQLMDFAAKNETGEPSFIENEPGYKYSLSSWIRFSQEPIKLAVGEITSIPYQIVVPKDAEPGGHYGVIFFSTEAPKDVGEGEAKVGAQMKVGQLILVTVPGNTTEKGAVASFKSKFINLMPHVSLFKEGTKFWNFQFEPRWSWNIKFTTRIQNQGNVHFKPKGNIEIKNLLGKKLTSLTVNEKNGNTLPDSTRRFENSWTPEWWRVGIYQAFLVMTYGESNNALSDTNYLVVLPWWFIAVLIVVLILFIRFIRKRRARKRNKSLS